MGVKFNATGSNVPPIAVVIPAAVFTAPANDVVDATYGTQEQTVITNLRTRVAELETVVTALVTALGKTTDALEARDLISK